MRRRSTYVAAVDFEDDMKVEIVGIPDDSEDAGLRQERVQKLIAKIILLGQTKGRPRKEALDEEKIAA